MNKMTLRIAVISWHQNNNGNISQEILPFKVKGEYFNQDESIKPQLTLEHLADLNHFK